MEISKLLDSINVLYNRKNNIMKLFDQMTVIPFGKSIDHDVVESDDIIIVSGEKYKKDNNMLLDENNNVKWIIIPKKQSGNINIIKKFAYSSNLTDIIPKIKSIIHTTEEIFIIEYVIFGNSKYQFLNDLRGKFGDLNLEMVFKGLTTDTEINEFINACDILSLQKTLLFAVVSGHCDLYSKNIALQYSDSDKKIKFKLINFDKLFCFGMRSFPLFEDLENNKIGKLLKEKANTNDSNIYKKIDNIWTNLKMISKLFETDKQKFEFINYTKYFLKNYIDDNNYVDKIYKYFELWYHNTFIDAYLFMPDNIKTDLIEIIKEILIKHGNIDADWNILSTKYKLGMQKDINIKINKYFSTHSVNDFERELIANFFRYFMLSKMEKIVADLSYKHMVSQPQEKSWSDYKEIVTKYDKSFHKIAENIAIMQSNKQIKDLVSKIESKIKYKDTLGTCDININFDTWESVIREIISAYVGYEYGQLNNLLSGNYYKLKSIKQKPRPMYFLMCKILSYFIQNCNFETDLILFRGVNDKTTEKIETTKYKFQMEKIDNELYDILTKITNGKLNIYELGNVISEWYEYEYILPKKSFYKKQLKKPEELKKYQTIKKALGEKMDDSINDNIYIPEVQKKIYELKEKLEYYTPYPAIKNQISQVGKSIVFPGFSSTTLYRERIEHKGSTYLPVNSQGKVNNCCLFKIMVPKGFPAMYIGGLFGKDEKEILLPPCIKFVVKKVENNGNEITLYPTDYKQIVSSFDEFVEDMKNYLKYTRCNDDDENEKIIEEYSKEYEKYRCSITYSTDI